MTDQISLKQIKNVTGSTFDAKQDGEAVAGTDTAELVAGKDDSGNAQMLSVDTSGRANVVVASAPSVSLSHLTAPTSSTLVGGSDGGNLRPVKVSSAGVVSVEGTLRSGAKGATAAGDVTSTNASANCQPLDVILRDTSGGYVSASGSGGGILDDRTSTGTLTAAAQTVVMSAQGLGSCVIQISGTWTANLFFEATIDDTNWSTVYGYPPDLGYSAGQALANGMWAFAVAGFSKIRVRCASYSSGSAVIKIEGGVGSSVIKGTIQANVLSMPTVGVIQNTAAALSGAWPVKVTDGTNTQPTGDIASRSIFHKVTDGTNTAAVKAASTAPAASDPSLVVSVSPNKPGRSTCANSNVTAATSSTTVLSSNTGRLGATFWNDSTSVCYLKFGSTASSTSCNVKLVADAYYELPTLADGPYTGIITAIWVSANGALRVGEVTF